MQALRDVPRQFIELGERNLAFIEAGVGDPLVVLDGGLGHGIDCWARVFHTIADTTRVLAYDRAGIGMSQRAQGPRTALDAVDDLHRLLTTVDRKGPAILVGFSFGGVIARLYADRFPDAVAEIVLVDAPHPELITRLLAALPPEWETSLALVALRHKLVTGYGDPSCNREQMDLPHSAEQLAKAGSLGGLPLVVISAGRASRWEAGIPHQLTAQLDAIRRGTQRELALLSTTGHQITAEESGHLVPFDQPAVIIVAVQQMVDAIRANRLTDATQPPYQAGTSTS